MGQSQDLVGHFIIVTRFFLMPLHKIGSVVVDYLRENKRAALIVYWCD